MRRESLLRSTSRSRADRRMGPYYFDFRCSAPEIDGLRSSDLCHVETGNEMPSVTASQFNPCDLAPWPFESMVPDPSPTPDTWTAQIYFPPPIPTDEDSAIRLVHLLMACADSVHRGDSLSAVNLIDEMAPLLARVGTDFGIGRVAGCFIDALYRRLHSMPVPPPAAEDEIIYRQFYDAFPYLKFAHFTANQAILDAFDGHDRVHVIDLDLKYGLQWPAFIKTLAVRPGGAPSLRLTAVGPPSPDGRDSLREIGLKLANLARSVNVRFSFRGIAANRLDEVKPWMLDVLDGEALAINSIFQLHHLLPEPDSHGPIDTVLSWIALLRPKIVTVIEQEADHNKPGFVDRFTEALFYYSTVFDSLERGKRSAAATTAAEVFLRREICNIVCCEGLDRVERHEPMGKWRGRLDRAGLRPVRLASTAAKQARMLLTIYSEEEGYGVEEVDGWLTLGWHRRPLIAASAWRAGDDVAVPFIPDNLIFNSGDLGDNGISFGRDGNYRGGSSISGS